MAEPTGDPTVCPHVDLWDPATQEDWYPAYDRLREDAPIYRIPGTTMHVLTRYEDLAWVSKRTDLFPNGTAPRDSLMQDPEAIRIYRAGNVGKRPLSVDPPAHRRYRALVDGFFNARGAARQAEHITAVVNELVDAWLPAPGETGEIEFIADFAMPLPVRIITVMLGFPVEDTPQLKVWSEAWAMPFTSRLTPEQQRDVATKGVEFQRYILSIVEEKRRRPDDTVISHLAHVDFQEHDGAPTRKLTDPEILSTVDHLYIGGNETTTFALASGVWLMLRDPAVHARLRAEPAKIAQFVEEVLRLESPTQGLYRHTATDVELHGVTIPKGSTILLRFAAANRDPRVFPAPAALDLDRPNSARHVAFGQGEHHCPGAGLSRLEQVIAHRVLLERVADWWLLDPSPRHRPWFGMRALEELRLGVRG